MTDNFWLMTNKKITLYNYNAFVINSILITLANFQNLLWHQIAIDKYVAMT